MNEDEKVRPRKATAEQLTPALCSRRRWSRLDKPACLTGASGGQLEQCTPLSHLGERQACEINHPPYIYILN